MIGIIDYGMGNLKSVQNACSHLGFAATVLHSPNELFACDHLILPGVGAFPDCMKQLSEHHLIEAIHQAVQMQIPLLGICLGMQVLFEAGEEVRYTKGLGILKGTIKLMKDTQVKIPHIGWNDVTLVKEDVLWEGLSHPYVYYVHSYCACDYDPQNLIGTSTYGSMSIPSAFHKDNVWACQFHPEKSGEDGLQMLRSFLTYSSK